MSVHTRSESVVRNHIVSNSAAQDERKISENRSCKLCNISYPARRLFVAVIFKLPLRILKSRDSKWQ